MFLVIISSYLRRFQKKKIKNKKNRVFHFNFFQNLKIFDVKKKTITIQIYIYIFFFCFFNVSNSFKMSIAEQILKKKLQKNQLQLECIVDFNDPYWANEKIVLGIIYQIFCLFCIQLLLFR
jgi:hypothetical protein